MLVDERSALLFHISMLSLCSCSYTCIPACSYTCIPACSYTCIPACSYTCIPAWSFTCTPACSFTCIPACSYTCIPACSYTCTPAFSFTCTLACSFTCTPACSCDLSRYTIRLLIWKHRQKLCTFVSDNSYHSWIWNCFPEVHNALKKKMSDLFVPALNAVRANARSCPVLRKQDLFF